MAAHGRHGQTARELAVVLEAEPELQHKAVALVKEICQKTGINLAGFDVIFKADNDTPEPMLLEINYFFGRKGLGGSEAYYQILLEEIQSWLADLRLIYKRSARWPTLRLKKN